MAMKRCPGSLSFSQPKIEMVRCPDCGVDVEFWSDEATGSCPACSRTVIRQATQSCVDWCRYAKECLGDEKFKKYGEMKAALRKSALINAIQSHGDDPKAMVRARKLLAYAEMLLPGQTDADPNVVMAAASLHPLVAGTGIRTEPVLAPPGEQFEAGLAAAQAILGQLGYPEGLINEVSELLGSPADPRRQETAHFKLLHDILLLADSEKQRQRAGGQDLPAELLGSFLTAAGRVAATHV